MSKTIDCLESCTIRFGSSSSVLSCWPTTAISVACCRKGLAAAMVARTQFGTSSAIDVKKQKDRQSVSWLTEGQVFHLSLRKSVPAKVRKDLGMTQRHGLDHRLIILVTNRRCDPKQKDTLKADCRTRYGTPETLEILDQEWLRLPLDGAWQSVRRRYQQGASAFAVDDDRRFGASALTHCS